MLSGLFCERSLLEKSSFAKRDPAISRKVLFCKRDPTISWAYKLLSPHCDRLMGALCMPDIQCKSTVTFPTRAFSGWCCKIDAYRSCTAYVCVWRYEGIYSAFTPPYLPPPSHYTMYASASTLYLPKNVYVEAYSVETNHICFYTIYTSPYTPPLLHHICLHRVTRTCMHLMKAYRGVEEERVRAAMSLEWFWN